MTEQQSPEQVARQRLQEQESAERQQKLNEFTKQEAERRRVEEEEAAAEKRRAEAGKRAGELGVRRAELEEQAQGQMNALTTSLDDLRNVDASHRRELHAADALRGAAQYQDLSKVLHGWIRAGLLRDNPASRVQILAQLDALTVAAEPESRAPAPGIPGSDPQDAPRREANWLLSTLDQRSTMLRRQYARDLSYGELVSPDEKDQVEQLSEEQREQVQGMLTGENGSE